MPVVSTRQATRLLRRSARATALSTATPHLWRGTPGDPATDGVAATDRGAITATVIRNKDSQFQQTAAAGSVWASDWIVLADAAADIRQGDVISDGTRAFLVTATPETDMGFLLAPAEVYDPAPPVVG
jgi:hypothetical protein